MKKLLAILLFISSFCNAQTVQLRCGFYPNGQLGKIYTDTVYTLARTAGQYFNSFGNFVSLADTTRSYFSATSPIFYNSSTGVISSQQFTSLLAGYVPLSGGGTTNFLRADGSWAAPAGGASGWNLTGNSGTTSGTNFIGTSDDINVMFKRNGFLSGLLDSLSTTTGRTLFGVGAGAATTVNNTAFGFNALRLATTGSANVAIGDLTLRSNLIGSGNSAIGSQALLNSTGSNNTAIGAGSMSANTSGAGNVAVGFSALAANLTTTGNTAVGYQSLTANTTTNNTGVGYQALKAATSGNANTAVGYLALGTAISGSYNVAVGEQALTTATGIGNTAIGGQSGRNLTTGIYNTLIGVEYVANKNLTTGTKNTMIGANIAITNSALSNSIILSDGDGNQRYFANATGQTGITKTTPSATLHLPHGRVNPFGAPLKFTYYNLPTTATSGNGTVSIITFAAQGEVPFSVGDSVIVAGVTPTAYNGTWRVTAVTTTTVSLACTATGVQTVAGTVTAGALLTTAEKGAMEYNGTRPYFTGNDGIRGFVSLTFTGTAAPATTPSAVGDHFIDTVNKKEYVATGTSSSADWTILN